MVAPVTGPFSRSWTLKGPPSGFGFLPDWVAGSRTWRRQAKPFTLPLEYSYNNVAITSYGGGDAGDYQQVSQLPSFRYSQALVDRLYASVYEKFMDKAKKDAAELAVTLAEWRKSRDMIHERATRLIKGIRAARRGDIRTLKSLWGKGAGVRSNLKRQGSNVLEYSFGWAPLVSDIATACAVLGAGIPPPYVKVTQKVSYTSDSGWRDLGAVLRRETVVGSIQWGLRSHIRVTNPNALLLNELGLANPASVLWEMTPWSFVVDYFVNVSAFLAQFTDDLGFELERPNKTFFASEDGFGFGKWDVASPPSYEPKFYKWTRVHVNRSLGVPGPRLVVKLPWRMSVQRASTSIALLLQQLRK